MLFLLPSKTLDNTSGDLLDLRIINGKQVNPFAGDGYAKSHSGTVERPEVGAEPSHEVPAFDSKNAGHGLASRASVGASKATEPQAEIPEPVGRSSAGNETEPVLGGSGAGSVVATVAEGEATAADQAPVHEPRVIEFGPGHRHIDGEALAAEW